MDQSEPKHIPPREYMGRVKQDDGTEYHLNIWRDRDPEEWRVTICAAEFEHGALDADFFMKGGGFNTAREAEVWAIEAMEMITRMAGIMEVF